MKKEKNNPKILAGSARLAVDLSAIKYFRYNKSCLHLPLLTDHFSYLLFCTNLIVVLGTETLFTNIISELYLFIAYIRLSEFTWHSLSTASSRIGQSLVGSLR